MPSGEVPNRRCTAVIQKRGYDDGDVFADVRVEEAEDGACRSASFLRFPLRALRH